MLCTQRFVWCIAVDGRPRSVRTTAGWFDRKSSWWKRESLVVNATECLWPAANRFTRQLRIGRDTQTFGRTSYVIISRNWIKTILIVRPFNADPNTAQLRYTYQRSRRSRGGGPRRKKMQGCDRISVLFRVSCSAKKLFRSTSAHKCGFYCTMSIGCTVLGSKRFCSDGTLFRTFFEIIGISKVMVKKKIDEYTAEMLWNFRKTSF